MHTDAEAKLTVSSFLKQSDDLIVVCWDVEIGLVGIRM